MAIAPFNSVSAATDQQVVVPGPTASGPGLTLAGVRTATLAELRVASEILNRGAVPDLNSLRADQLNDIVKPGAAVASEWPSPALAVPVPSVTPPSTTTYALDFTVAAQFATFASSIIDYERTQPATIMAVVKHSGTPGAGYEPVVWTHANSNVNAGQTTSMELWINELGFVSCCIINTWPTNVIYVQGHVNVCDGNWHLIGYTYDGSSTAAGVQIYSDGVKDTSMTINDDTLSATTVSNTPPVIGNQIARNYPLLNLGFLTIANVQRSNAYMTSYSVNSLPAIDSSTQLYMTFSEGSGTAIHDTSQNSYVATTYGWPAWVAGPSGVSPAASTKTNFGYQNQGGSPVSWNTYYGATIVAAPISGNVTSISVYLAGTSGQTIYAGLYATAASVPTTLLTTGSAAGLNGWMTIPVTPYAVVGGTTYGLAVAVSGAGTGAAQIGTGTGVYTNYAGGALAGSWPGGGGSEGGQFSIYATIG